MAEDIMFQEAMDAIHQGKRVRARDLLTRLLRADQSNPQYWLWMSSVVDTAKEQIYCLQNALRLEPHNAAARQGLILLGERAPDADIAPAPPVWRKWVVPVLEVPRRSRLKAALGNPIVRATIITCLVLMFICLAGVGVYQVLKPGPARYVYIPSRTPGPSPTFTSTPTALGFTPTPPTATPTFQGPLPLWALLEATYTPTPFLAATPHAANEAFSIGLRAYQRGDYERALENFQQAVQMNPEAADIPFIMGEIYQAQGDYGLALQAYQEALMKNPAYAPANLGLARAELALDPAADVRDLLDQAIASDPKYGEAYLERAAWLLAKGEDEAAMQDLEAAQELLPDSPLLNMHLAKIHLEQGEKQTALEEAQRALELDLTLLPAYLVLGEAAIANEEYDQALKALNTYTTYETGDASAWAMLGWAYYATENYTRTLEMLDKAIALKKMDPDAHFYRGMVLIELDRGQEAVNEIYLSMQFKPQSFAYNLNFSRALLTAGRLGDALAQINRTEDVSGSDEELAQVYYWRATILEAIGNYLSARKDWDALLALELEDGAVPQEWLETAEMRLTVTPAVQATGSVMPTPGETASGTPPPTSQVTASPSAAPPSATAASSTPARTPSPTPTP
jgi:tetratricopeptide (TPR) repeat protein